MCANFQTKRTSLSFGPKFAQKWILGWNFNNLSLDSEFAPPRYHVSQFLVKMDNFEIFGLNLGKVRYFGSNIVEGVAESWVEVDGAGRSWFEEDGAGWRWVHGLVIPKTKYL